MLRFAQAQNRTQGQAGALTGVEQPGNADQQTCRESFSTIAPPVIAESAVFLGQDSMPLQPPVQAPQGETRRPAKRRRSGFEVREEPISDFISKGLITVDYAVDCFTACVPRPDGVLYTDAQ
jgi:hypothetical protein